MNSSPTFLALSVVLTLAMIQKTAAQERHIESASSRPDNRPTATAAAVPTDPQKFAESDATKVEMVQLNFPENIEVKVLIDYVAKRLGIKLMYEEALVKKRITMIIPQQIPLDSLPGVLQSVLKTANLTMIDGDEPGWKKIVAVQDLPTVIRELQLAGEAFRTAEPTLLMAQAFELQSAGVTNVDQIIKPFLSKPAGSTFLLANQNTIIVMDYADVLRRVAPLIALVDRPADQVQMQFVPVRHWEADVLARQVTSLMTEKNRLSSTGKPLRVSMTVEPRGNQIVLIAPAAQEKEALELIEKLDVPGQVETKTYRFLHVPPERVDRLVQQAFGDKDRYKSTIDAESGMLIVTASPMVQQHVETLKRDLDVPLREEESHVRFYKIVNRTAAEIMATIRTLEAGGGLTAEALSGIDGPLAAEPKITEGEKLSTGPNVPPAPPGVTPPRPPMDTTGVAEGTVSVPEAAPAPEPGGAIAAASRASTSQAVVTADPITNSIVVIAPPAVQKIYAKLIETLDKRLPQVMVEVTLITLDTSESFSLGIDISRAGDVGNAGRYLVFSSTGLSTVDPVSGALTLAPGLGFNGVLLDPDTVNVVVRALASHARAKVVSAPKVLVNDNGTATLSSIAESPYVSINVGDTVSTTSFAGYASAGTTVTVTPHISQGDYLLLNYAFTLNSFTGAGAAGVPPPRQTNTINSTVTVPDGHAIIVGGLTRRDISRSIAGLPFFIHMPILKYLFGNETRNDTDTTLFVFIRPVILRDDQFTDLKYISDVAAGTAGLSSTFPESLPMMMP